ncbi:MAG TPA: hypothetical protein QF517_11095, partial [Pseudomonadales bacterium]|nr:hypothetical protein [Pseudomonadales bacterium]
VVPRIIETGSYQIRFSSMLLSDQKSARKSVQQRAIDFYNITAAINKVDGASELIGVDTYA